MSNRSSTWLFGANGDEYEVLVPLRTDFADYAARVGDALQTLAAAEDRSQMDVLGDLFAVSADVVKVRSLIPSAEDGTLPLRDGVELLQGAYDLLTFAACAAYSPRQIYSNHRPQQVIDYMRSLRLGQTERGSYVVTVASPVPPHLTPAERGLLFDVPEPPPFPRAVTLTLARSLVAMRGAVEQSAVTGQMEPWEAAVESGVSANLCEAVVKLAGQSKRSDVEVQVAWSLRRPTEVETPRSVRLTSDTLGYIEEASRWFRQRHPVADTEIAGEVVTLDYNPRKVAEKAVILGFVNGKPRRVTVDLTDSSRPTAIKAYTEHLPVTCAGTLCVRAGNTSSGTCTTSRSTARIEYAAGQSVMRMSGKSTRLRAMESAAPSSHRPTPGTAIMTKGCQ